VKHGLTGNNGMNRESVMTSGRRVLIIDDSPEVGEVFRRVLESDRFNVTTAQSGSEGLAYALAKHFDLIITDLMLPDMLGYEVARRLRADPRTANVPIAAFTVLIGIEDEQLARDAGCDTLIGKPCSIDEFLEHVHHLLA